jgi:hypothetical protein
MIYLQSWSATLYARGKEGSPKALTVTIYLCGITAEQRQTVAWLYTLVFVLSSVRYQTRVIQGKMGHADTPNGSPSMA